MAPGDQGPVPGRGSRLARDLNRAGDPAAVDILRVSSAFMSPSAGMPAIGLIILLGRSVSPSFS